MPRAKGNGQSETALAALPHANAATTQPAADCRPLPIVEGGATMILPRYAKALLVVALLLPVTAACSSGKSTAQDSKGKLKIALSNSFIGNGWRVEMENVFKAACAMPPYKDQVDCSVFNAGN